MTDTLDPKDWSAYRKRAHDMLDHLIDFMETKGDGPVWRPPTDAKTDFADHGGTGLGPEKTDEALLSLLPYHGGNTHPRFFGWVQGAGTPSGVIADMVASTMNPNCGGRWHAGIEVGRNVVRWALKTFDFPEDGSGLITTGTSMATFVALKAARDSRFEFETRQTGIRDLPRLIGYTSEGVHNCIVRTFDMLGLGTDNLRRIAVDENREIRLDALKAQIAQDRADGHIPFVVCATAGTVNTGAIDDLNGVADIAEDENLWFHIDGAFGACLQLSDTHRHRIAGLSRADSLAFDFHKWLQVNYDAGCVLLRSEDLHRRTFSDRPDYLVARDRGLAAGNPWPVEYGPELSRGFRALKVWAQVMEFGEAGLAKIIDQNIAQAGYLADLIEASDKLELLTYRGLNICCFRYARPGLTEADIEAINAELLVTIQERGIAAPSSTRIGEKLALRVNITNHRTRFEDIDVLANAIVEIGDELMAKI